VSAVFFTSKSVADTSSICTAIGPPDDTKPPLEHASAHILNAPIFERKYARVYLGDPESREAVELRKQIANGAREALEEQYWDIMERTIQARPAEARLGGDPSVANKVRAFVAVRHYRSGEWEDRIEVRSAAINNLYKLF
jgi:nuclear pore complex protein Nup93